MVKPIINYIHDALMGISFVLAAWSAIVLGFLLPRGQDAGQELFWGISRQVWYPIHKWAGLVFIALALIHLVLHFKWIVVMTKSLFKRK
jgi:hypothetical protein